MANCKQCNHPQEWHTKTAGCLGKKLPDLELNPLTKQKAEYRKYCKCMQYKK